MESVSTVEKAKRIVVIGGGTGIHSLLRSLRKQTSLQIDVIVSSLDDGGSTGEIKKEDHGCAVGDARKAIAALANTDDPEIAKKVRRFNKRKDDYNGVRGNIGNHNFAIEREDMVAEFIEQGLSEAEAKEKAELAMIEHFSKEFGLHPNHQVHFSTLKYAQLVAEYYNPRKLPAAQAILKGEHIIDEPPATHDGTEHISRLRVEPVVEAYSGAIKAILNADTIILGPGDLYTSIGAVLVVGDIKKAMMKTRANIVYAANLVTKFGHTYGMTAWDHVSQIAKYTGKIPDYTIFNTTKIPDELVAKYQHENSFPLYDDLPEESNFMRGNFLDSREIIPDPNDQLPRSMVRHDGEKLAEIILKIPKKTTQVV